MQEVPSTSSAPKPKTEEKGGGWFAWCKQAVNYIGQTIRVITDQTDACENVEKERIKEELEIPGMDRFSEVPIEERKAKKAKEEAFRKRIREETGKSEEEVEKHVRRFCLKEALVRINYEQQKRLKKTVSFLGNHKDTQAIEKGRTFEEPSIEDRSVSVIKEDPLATSIKEIEPSELLKLALEVEIEVEEAKAKDKGDIHGFEEEVFKPNQENFMRVFDKIENVLKDPKRFPDFNREEFDRAKFEKDPIGFLIEINSSHDRTDLAFIVDKLWEEDPEFSQNLGTISLASEKYFEESLFAARKFDKEYMADAKDFDKFEYILEEIHENNLEEEWDELDGAFKENFGDHWNEIRQRCAVKEKEQFDQLFSALVKNDSEYQAAQKKVQEILEKNSTNGAFDFSKLFFENAEFREAYAVVSRKYQAVCDTTGFQFKYNEDFVVDPSDYAAFLLQEGITGAATLAKDRAAEAAQYVKDHPGRCVYSPAAVLGSALIGWQVAPLAVGAVFTGHVIKKVAPAVKLELEKSGVFYDIRQARLDREFRHPYITKIFAKEFSKETKIQALQELLDENLLFEEDLKDCPADLLKEIGTKNLPSIEKIKNARKEHLKILNKEVFATDQMRLNTLNAMMTAGILYKEDILKEDLNIQREFLKQNNATLDEFTSMEAESQHRNRNLFIAKGTLVPDFQKLEAIKTLHEKGVFFKEDLLILKKEFPELHEKVIEQGLTLDKLPEPVVRYKTELSLKTEHDKIREGILSQEGNSQDGFPSLEGLKALYKEGLCFKQDLAKVDEGIKNSFAEFLSKQPLKDTLDGLPDQETFYQYGMAKRVVKFAEAISNIVWKGGEAVYNNPVNIVYGPLKGAKGIVQIGAEALEETFGTFTDIKTTALSDRVAEALPGDKKLKAHATYAFNKGVGTLKWSAIGAGIGGMVLSLFGLSSIPGMQIGGAIGGFFGMCKTDGKMSQIPKGGFIRAFKFGAYGAIAGAVVAVALIAAGPIGWAVGAIALSTALIVVSVGSSFIPLVILGAVAGYYYAGLTGKDEIKEEVDPADILYYREPNIESAFLAAVPV